MSQERLDPIVTALAAAYIAQSGTFIIDTVIREAQNIIRAVDEASAKPEHDYAKINADNDVQIADLITGVRFVVTKKSLVDRLIRNLHAADIYWLDDLLKQSRQDIIGIYGMGRSQLGLLGEVLRENNIKTKHGLERLGLKIKI